MRTKELKLQEIEKSVIFNIYWNNDKPEATEKSLIFRVSLAQEKSMFKCYLILFLKAQVEFFVRK